MFRTDSFFVVFEKIYIMKMFIYECTWFETFFTH